MPHRSMEMLIPTRGFVFCWNFIEGDYSKVSFYLILLTYLLFFNFSFISLIAESGFYHFYWYVPYIGARTQLQGLPWPVFSRVQGLPPKTTQDITWIHDNQTQIPSPYILWNNLLLGKNPTTEPGIEPGTSWSVGNDVITRLSGRAYLFILTINIYMRI